MTSVLVHSGCYNKIALTEWFISNKHLLIKALEADKSKIKLVADTVSGEGLLSDSQIAVLYLCAT